MEPQDLCETRPEIGHGLTVVLLSDARATLVPVKVTSFDPLILSAAEPFNCPALPVKVLLVGADGSQTWKAEAQLTEVADAGSAPVLTLGDVSWERLDRRRHYRTAASMPMSVKLIQDDADEVTVSVVNGHTEDLSIGGARIQIGQSIPLGTLVQFKCTMAPQVFVRTLAIVSRHHPMGALGLEFVDYIGSAHADLHEFLNHAA